MDLLYFLFIAVLYYKIIIYKQKVTFSLLFGNIRRLALGLKNEYGFCRHLSFNCKPR
jgi:hypothetical protein